MNERHTALLEYVVQHGKTKVNVLAEYLNTSEVTIRKDLKELVKLGMLKRERGYAVPNDPDDLNYRIAFHYEQKLQIAQTAAELIQDGETVIIETGSTCALFAEELARTKQNITIITNSLYIAGYVHKYPHIQIILLGGVLQPNTQSMVGPLTKHAVQFFHVDKIFTGTDGYSRDFGFTGDDLIRSDTLHEMVSAADHTYVLTTSDKFNCPGAVSFLPLEKVDTVITDTSISESEYHFLTQKGITIIFA